MSIYFASLEPHPLQTTSQLFLVLHCHGHQESSLLNQRQWQEHRRQVMAGAVFLARPLLLREAGTGFVFWSTQGRRGRILPHLTMLPHLGVHTCPLDAATKSCPSATPGVP